MPSNYEPTINRRTLEAILTDASEVLRHAGSPALAREVDHWKSRTTMSNRGFENILLFGFLIAVCAGLAAMGLRTGYWEWTVGSVVFAAFITVCVARILKVMEDPDDTEGGSGG